MNTIVETKIRVCEQSRGDDLGACIVNVKALYNDPEIILQELVFSLFNCKLQRIGRGNLRIGKNES